MIIIYNFYIYYIKLSNIIFSFKFIIIMLIPQGNHVIFEINFSNMGSKPRKIIKRDYLIISY